MTVNINELNTNIAAAKKDLPSDDDARASLDNIRDSIVDPKNPQEVKEDLSRIIANVGDTEKLAAAVGDLKDTLSENINAQEEKVDQYRHGKDLAKEAAWISLGIAAAVVGVVATGGGVLAATAIIGLTAAVVDLAIKIPREIHEKNKSNPEYKLLGLLGKASFIVKEMKNDMLKASASAVTLAGAAVLLVTLFSPALILAAPVIMPVVGGVLLAIGGALLAKTAYEYSQKEQQSTQQLETSVSETNKLLEDTDTLQTGANNNEEKNNTLEIVEANGNIDTSEESATNQNVTKDFKQALRDTNISVNGKSDGEELETKTTEDSLEKSQSCTKALDGKELETKTTDDPSEKSQNKSSFTEALDANNIPRPQTAVKTAGNDSKQQPDSSQKISKQDDESEGEAETRGPHP